MAKIKRVPQSVWDKYTKTLNDFMEMDTAKKTIIWRRFIDVPAVFGEDRLVPPYTDIPIEVLFAYNTFRTWPINTPTESGEWDMNNVVFYVSKNYLKENGWLNSEQYFEFDRSKDRFIMDGHTYKSAGDTSASQAYGSDILVMVILKREELISEDRLP